MADVIPYQNLSSVLSLLTLTPQLTANMGAIQTALDHRIAFRKYTVSGYSATGATTTKIALPLSVGFTPYAVLLARVQLKTDPGGDLTVVPRFNFSVTSTNLWVYEPGGLVLNSTYDLTFLILEE